MCNTPTVGVQDRVTSFRPSINQTDAATIAKGSPISTVAKNQLGQTNTSPAMQPQSGLITVVKTEIEDVAPDIIHGGTFESPLLCTTVLQGIMVSPLIVEEGRMTNVTRCDHKTKKNVDNELICRIDVNFLQQVAIAFDKVKESTKLAKKSISMSPSLEPTFLAIVKEYGDITSDCSLESGYMLTSVLEAICKVVQELQKKHLAEFDCDLFNSYCSVVRDAEKMKVNVKWLETRLDEIKNAVNCIVETKKLNDEKNRIVEQINDDKKNLQSMKAELEKLKSEIEERENLLDLDTLLTEDMSSLINDRALRIQQFQNMPLMEAFQ
uniref:Phospholipase n=1 Tax=Solanum tuberosum TaxID=4113 RepID=M1AWC5_SOLTU